MLDYYKDFFEHNISSVFLVEVAVPVYIHSPVKQQLEAMFKSAYIKDFNLVTTELYFGADKNVKSKIINQKLTSIWKQEDYDTEDAPVYQFYKTFIESGYDIKRVESKVQTPKGDDVWFLVSMRSIVKDGYLRGWWGSQIDVTELKRLNEDLQDTNKQLQEKVEEVKLFAYISSHNLQTPLMNLKAFSALILKKYTAKLDDTGRKSLHFLNEASNKMSKILHELVYYFNLDEKNEDLSAIYPTEIIREIIEEEQDLINDVKAKITCIDLPQITADEKQIKRIFHALIHYSLICNKKATNLHIQITHQFLSNKIKFSVTDNGEGLAKRETERIFKLHSGSINSAGGMGLLLARKIVMLNGGEIWAESELNKGTTIHFTLEKI